MKVFFPWKSRPHAAYLSFSSENIRRFREKSLDIPEDLRNGFAEAVDREFSPYSLFHPLDWTCPDRTYKLILSKRNRESEQPL